MITPNNRHFLFRLATVSGLVLGIAIAISGTVSFNSVRLALDKISGDGSADPYTPVLHQRIQIVALATGATVIGSCICVLVIARTVFGARLFFRMRSEWNRLTSDSYRLCQDVYKTIRTNASLVVVSFVVAMATRILFIQAPIRFDEAISWRDYAAKPIWLTVALYNDPNNHVFHNVLAGSIMKKTGESLVALRSVSLIASCLTVVMSAILTARIASHIAPSASGVSAGLVTTVALCSHPMWNEFSIYARGYSLMTMLLLLSILCLRYEIANQNKASWIVSVLLASLAAWTIPVAVYPVFATIVVLCLDRWPIYKAFRWGASVAAITIMLYSPILIVSGPSAIVGNSYVKSLTSAEWFSRLPSTMDSYRGPLLWDAHIAIQGLLFATFIFCSIRSNGFRKNLITVGIAITSIAFVVAMQRVLPPERTWVWIVVPLSIAMSMAIAILATQFTASKAYSATLSWCLAGVFVSMPAYLWLSGKTLDESMAIGPCPEASNAIHFLAKARRPSEPIVAVCPASGTLDWYAKQSGFERTAFDPPKLQSLEEETISNSVIVAVVNNSQFKQTVTDVLGTNVSTQPWLNGHAVLIWESNTLAIYRVEKGLKTHRPDLLLQ